MMPSSLSGTSLTTDETDGLILSIGAQVDDETVKSLPLAS